jgi:uncharacterized protein YndB with AHSA1/START domain
VKNAALLALALLGPGQPAQPADNQQTLTHKIIRKTRVFNCSIDLMWWKWTTHEGLKTFFGEDNTMELKIGGPFEIYFSKKAQAGLRGSEGCKVISYLPKEMFSFSWNAPPKFPGIRTAEYHTWVVVNFKPVKGNRTEVSMSHLGWLQGGEWDQVYEYFDKAWITVFDWLEESCKKKDTHR